MKNSQKNLRQLGELGVRAPSARPLMVFDEPSEEKTEKVYCLCKRYATRTVDVIPQQSSVVNCEHGKYTRNYYIK